MSQGAIFNKIQLAPEDSAYGTKGTVWTELPRVQTSSLRSIFSKIVSRGLGEGLNATNVYHRSFDTEISFTLNPVDFDFLKYWIGPKTGAGTAGDPYLLTEATKISAESAGAGILQPFSLERLNDEETTDSAEVYLGCVGNTFTISGTIGEEITVNATAIGQKSLEATSGETYTPVTTAAFIPINGTWKWGATPSALSGVRSFAINYTNNLVFGDDTRSIESFFQGIPKYGRGRAYTFSVDIIMAQALASTILTDFFGQSPASGPVDGSSAISPTSSLQFEIELVNGSRYGNIDLDEAFIIDIERTTTLGDGLVVLRFTGQALKALSNVPFKWWTV